MKQCVVQKRPQTSRTLGTRNKRFGVESCEDKIYSEKDCRGSGVGVGVRLKGSQTEHW